MKKYLSLIAAGFCVMGLIFSCGQNPFTGQKSLNFVSNSQLFPSSFQQYETFLKENKVISGTEEAQRVASVGTRIKAAAERWLRANGYSDYLNGYQWEYKLVQNKEINAWCMPGGENCSVFGYFACGQR